MNASRLRLVAGGDHHAAANDYGLASQLGVVALFDRRVKRIEIGVQNCRVSKHKRMFAPAQDGM